MALCACVRIAKKSLTTASAAIAAIAVVLTSSIILIVMAIVRSVKSGAAKLVDLT